ncbi:MAG: hypothetical protein GW815_00165, partial [Candidatus Moranbacteria bacterium]
MMKNDTQNITCPNCGTSISIDDVLTHQIESRLAKEYEDKEKKLRDILAQENQSILAEKESAMRKQVKENIEREALSEKKFLEEQLKE